MKMSTKKLQRKPCYRFFELLIFFDFFDFQKIRFSKKKRFRKHILHFFLELGKKLGNNFNVKQCDLSIYDASRRIPALLRGVSSSVIKLRVFFLLNVGFVPSTWWILCVAQGRLYRENRESYSTRGFVPADF